MVSSEDPEVLMGLGNLVLATGGRLFLVLGRGWRHILPVGREEETEMMCYGIPGLYDLDPAAMKFADRGSVLV